MDKKKVLQAYADGKIKDETTLKVFEMTESLKEEVDNKVQGLETKVDKAVEDIKSNEITFERVIGKIKGVKGDKGDKGDTIKGETGRTGNNGFNGKDGKDGRDGRDGVNGKDGVSVTADEVIEKVKEFIPDIKEIEDEIPQLGTEIRDSLELLQGKERLKREAIDGLDDYEEVSRLAREQKGGKGGGATARNFYQLLDAEGLTIADITSATIPFIIDGGGTTITTGAKGDIEIPFDCKINRVTLLADTTGSVEVNIYKSTYGNYPPTDSIIGAGGTIPAINSDIKYQDTTLTNWTTTISAGDILRFFVDSADTITRCSVNINISKT